MKRILIIEDDEKISKALVLRLQAAGYAINTAFDAVTGLSNAVKCPPDLILLDISLPAGNGLTLAERLNTLLPHPPPIIFLTASKQPGLLDQACKLGAAGFFEKPYQPEQLLATIASKLDPSAMAHAA